MSSKSKSKNKKPLETTLGKAGLNDGEDLSHIQMPIHTSVFGLKQVLSLYDTATEEVKHYITYECDIMYECRICRTIFRSLANFILHKRNYCLNRYTSLDPSDGNSHDLVCSMEEETTSIPEMGLSTIIDKLKEKQTINQLAQDIIDEKLEDENKNMNKDKIIEKPEFFLEKIHSNSSAVFQTMFNNVPEKGTKELMKVEVMEIHNMLDSDEAVLGADGKIFNFPSENPNGDIPKSYLCCTKCNLKFSTKKTLTYHLKYKHNKTRVVFVCPECKEIFANAWSVYRHLMKVHRKTSGQIKKMRDLIYSTVITREEEPARQEAKIEIMDDEHQWLSNVEDDNELQMCGGCGKRFERKAALISHAQMCAKRISVCNTIRETNARKKELEEQENREKLQKLVMKQSLLKGAVKRKPCIIVTYKENKENIVQELSASSSSDSAVSDVPTTKDDFKCLDFSSVFVQETSNELENLPSTSSEPFKANELMDCYPDSIEDSLIENAPSTSSAYPKAYPEIGNPTNTFDDSNAKLRRKAAPHMNEDELVCLSCKKTFLTNIQLLWHMSAHFSWFCFQCSKCSFVSFNKDDCVCHAKDTHMVDNAMLPSVVLPIPDWKTKLMSHEFQLLTNNKDLTGKLTDEIIVVSNNSFSEERLFVVKKELDESADSLLFSEFSYDKPDLNFSTDFKNDSSNSENSETIDISQELEESYQIDIPHEIYTIVEERTPELLNFERTPCRSVLPDADCFLPENYVTSQPSLTIEPPESPPVNIDPPICDKNAPNRPVRNRTKSVKILHDDFIYDLTNVIKMNESSSVKEKKRRPKQMNKTSNNNREMKGEHSTV